jgi:hypothetical protein
MAALWVIGFALVGAQSAWATATYDYTGNDFTTTTDNGPTTPPVTYTTSDKVTASITISAPLGDNLVDSIVPVPTFSFSDGTQTIDNTKATFDFFHFWTDASGNITQWNVGAAINTSPNTILEIDTANVLGAFPTGIVEDVGKQTLCGPGSTTTACDAFGDPFYHIEGLNDNLPGTWTASTTAVPEPGSLAFFGASLGALGVLRRRRR